MATEVRGQGLNMYFVVFHIKAYYGGLWNILTNDLEVRNFRSALQIGSVLLA